MSKLNPLPSGLEIALKELWASKDHKAIAWEVAAVIGSSKFFKIANGPSRSGVGFSLRISRRRSRFHPHPDNNELIFAMHVTKSRVCIDYYDYVDPDHHYFDIEFSDPKLFDKIKEMLRMASPVGRRKDERY